MAGRRTDVLHRGCPTVFVSAQTVLCAQQSNIATTPGTTGPFVHNSRTKAILY